MAFRPAEKMGVRKRSASIYTGKRAYLGAFRKEIPNETSKRDMNLRFRRADKGVPRKYFCLMLTEGCEFDPTKFR
jgi:hypothetical protein